MILADSPKPPIVFIILNQLQICMQCSCCFYGVQDGNNISWGSTYGIQGSYNIIYIGCSWQHNGTALLLIYTNIILWQNHCIAMSKWWWLNHIVVAANVHSNTALSNSNGVHSHITAHNNGASAFINHNLGNIVRDNNQLLHSRNEAYNIAAIVGRYDYIHPARISSLGNTTILSINS